jgi:hypothetical protein
VPGLSCELGIHHGGRGVDQFDRAHREEIPLQSPTEIIKKQNSRRTK